MYKTMLNHIFHTLLMYGRFSNILPPILFTIMATLPLLICTPASCGIALKLGMSTRARPLTTSSTISENVRLKTMHPDCVLQNQIQGHSELWPLHFECP